MKLLGEYVAGKIVWKLKRNVGSQLSDFTQTPKKIDDVAVNNGMHIPNDRMVSKPKIRGCPDLQFGVREL